MASLLSATQAIRLRIVPYEPIQPCRRRTWASPQYFLNGPPQETSGVCNPCWPRGKPQSMHRIAHEPCQTLRHRTQEGKLCLSIVTLWSTRLDPESRWTAPHDNRPPGLVVCAYCPELTDKSCRMEIRVLATYKSVAIE